VGRSFSQSQIFTPMLLYIPMLIENGSTLAEHNTDIYPAMSWLIVGLLVIIGSGIGFGLSVLKARMDEMKTGQNEIYAMLNKYVIESERRFGHNDVRLALLEQKSGLPIMPFTSAKEQD
jgi:hypothetical protein